MPINGSVAEVLWRQVRQVDGWLQAQAGRAGEIVRNEVRDLTPVGRIIDPEDGSDLGPSGELKAGWYTLPVIVVREPRRMVAADVSTRVFRAGAGNDVDHALPVNNGSRRHIIRGRINPKTGRRRVLRFWTDGQIRFAKSVNHPGAPGVHMAERGLAAADARWRVEGESRLRAFLARTDR